MPRGNFTDKQMKYTELVAAGVEEGEAVELAGYKLDTKYQVLNKLKNNQRITERIEFLRANTEGTDIEVACKEDRERYWTRMMYDPKNSGNVRNEASKLLGKSQGDFIERSKVETTNKTTHVMVIPAVTPEEWAKYWEAQN